MANLVKGLFVVMCLVLGVGCGPWFCVGDIQQDQKECQSQLENLAQCFPFVQGKVKSPEPQCCTNLKTVREKMPKCLCILIKDSSSPALGLSINTTLALEMPSLCKVEANISQCPVLLGISPSSPEAKIFEIGSNSSSTSPSSGGSTSSSTSSSSPDKSWSPSVKPRLGLCVMVALFNPFIFWFVVALVVLD